jgi:hypothetical protein
MHICIDSVGMAGDLQKASTARLSDVWKRKKQDVSLDAVKTDERLPVEMQFSSHIREWLIGCMHIDFGIPTMFAIYFRPRYPVYTRISGADLTSAGSGGTSRSAPRMYRGLLPLHMRTES